MSTSSKLSVDHISNILDSLKYMQNRQSTLRNYQAVWRQFNHFLLKLDRRPADLGNQNGTVLCTTG